MKHAIIPTDLSIDSLKTVHDVMAHYGNGELVKITLLHLLDIPTGIGDLLFRLRRLESRYPIPEDYRHAVEVLTNRYGHQLVQLRTSLEYGSSSAVLSNMLDAMRADAVFMQPGSTFRRPFEDSVDLYALMPATGFPVIEKMSRAKSGPRNASSISDLLLAGG